MNAGLNRMSTDPETRRAIAKRAIDRARVQGVPIDTDPAFLDLLEEWIRGEINMRTMRERYLAIIALRSAERRDPRISRFGINLPESSNEANGE